MPELLYVPESEYVRPPRTKVVNYADALTEYLPGHRARMLEGFGVREGAGDVTEAEFVGFLREVEQLTEDRKEK